MNPDLQPETHPDMTEFVERRDYKIIVDRERYWELLEIERRYKNEK